MSTHASSTKINQKEYLKKYVSGDKHKKKKKKDKDKRRGDKEKVKIIDDDLHVPDNDIDEELLLTGEDAPQIVGEYIDDYPNGDSNVYKWRSIVVKEEPEDKSNIERGNDNTSLWGVKNNEMRIKSEYSPDRLKYKQKRPDNSPLRRNHSFSPTRRGQKNSKSEHQIRNQSPRRNNYRSRSRENGSPKRSHRSSVDHSPRRKYENSPRRQHNKVLKQSPPRREHSPLRHRSNSSSEQFPRRGKSPNLRRRASIDQSPPRKQAYNNRREFSPQQHMQNPHNPFKKSLARNDSSPPRKQTINQSPRRQRGNSIENQRRNPFNPFANPLPNKRDKSPQFQQNSNAWKQPPPKRRDSDQSPPRRIRNNSTDFAPMKRNNNKISSPFRVKREKHSSEDLSPQRKSRAIQERRSPQQRQSRWNKPERVKSSSPPPTHKPKFSKTLDGKKAGLQDAHDLKIETAERRRKEERMFAVMPNHLSGRDAEVQIRNTRRRGERARNAETEDPEKQRRKEAHEKHKKELYDRWGKGLKQIEDYEARKAEIEYESNKPLARYRGDEDLERHLRDQERLDDPMLEYMRKKRKEREKNERIPTKPVYEGSYPENRFGIRPGYRWDGVDRSNGYEKKWFDIQNEKRAMQDEAYKYSVEDM